MLDTLVPNNRFYTRKLAATGSGGLSSVAAGISEALVETALGLAVAIPAVLAFNYLSAANALLELKAYRQAIAACTQFTQRYPGSDFIDNEFSFAIFARRS